MLNNCGLSLDVIIFRGVPEILLKKFAPEIEVLSGTEDGWEMRDDGTFTLEISPGLAATGIVFGVLLEAADTVPAAIRWLTHLSSQ